MVSKTSLEIFIVVFVGVFVLVGLVAPMLPDLVTNLGPIRGGTWCTWTCDKYGKNCKNVCGSDLTSLVSSLTATTAQTATTTRTTTSGVWTQCCGICSGYDCSQCKDACERVYGVGSGIYGTSTTTYKGSCQSWSNGGCGGSYATECPYGTMLQRCFNPPGNTETRCVTSDTCCNPGSPNDPCAKKTTSTTTTTSQPPLIVSKYIWVNDMDLTDGTLTGWTKLNGETSDAPALTSSPSLLYMAVRWTDNGIYLRNMSVSTLNWLDWAGLSRATSAAPSISLFNNKLYMAVKGSSDNVIWISSMDLSNPGVWSDWAQVPNGQSPSAPAITNTTDKLYMVTRGTDDKVYYNAMNTANAWSTWTVIPDSKTIQSAPDVSIFNGKLYVAVRSGNDIYFNSMDLSSGGWVGWTKMSSGQTSDAPALTSSPSLLYMAVRGTDNGVYYSTMGTSGVWSSWTNVKGNTTSAPAIDIFNNRLYMAIRGGTYEEGQPLEQTYFTSSNFACTASGTDHSCKFDYATNFNGDISVMFSLKNSTGWLLPGGMSIVTVYGATNPTGTTDNGEFHCASMNKGTYNVSWFAFNKSDTVRDVPLNSSSLAKQSDLQITCS